MAKKSRKKLFKECEEKLSTLRSEAIKDIASAKEQLNTTVSGDDGDISIALESRRSATIKYEQSENKLKQINAALERIASDNYGICEVTGEDIEDKRLLSIPWTRFSVEGAEINERNNRKFKSA